MADRKPPRLARGEAETLHALLQYQRESLLRKVDDLDEDSARWSPVASGTTLLWLVGHMADAEVTWVLHRFAGREPQPPTAGSPTVTLRAAADAYRRGWQRVDEVAFSGASLDELCRRPDAGPPVSLRWVLMHLLEETARHAGHADILRELIDGGTGRLPGSVRPGPAGQVRSGQPPPEAPDRQAMTDQLDSPDRTDPRLANEPAESTEASDPADPMDRIDPADPIDRIDPVDPIDKMDPDEPMLRIDPAEPARRRDLSPSCMRSLSQAADNGRACRPAGGGGSLPLQP